MIMWLIKLWNSKGYNEMRFERNACKSWSRVIVRLSLPNQATQGVEQNDIHWWNWGYSWGKWGINELCHQRGVKGDEEMMRFGLWATREHGGWPEHTYKVEILVLWRCTNSAHMEEGFGRRNYRRWEEREQTCHKLHATLQPKSTREHLGQWQFPSQD